ncbi:MAG: GNAT family N-acetyltransferase [Chitinophagaceae bacterium]
MDLRIIEYQSDAYKEMVELRMDVLRRPLGLFFTEEQLAREKDDILIGAFENEKMIGCCVLTPHNEDIIHLRQMAVKEDSQVKGIGKTIISFAEQTMIRTGYTLLMMHARKTALGFYQKCGYEIKGDEFTEVGIPHHYMEKKLSSIKK